VGLLAARLLGLRVRIPPGHGCLPHVNIVCCTGSGLCDGPIPLLEEFYRRSVCITKCDQVQVTLYTYNEQVEEVRLKGKTSMRLRRSFCKYQILPLKESLREIWTFFPMLRNCTPLHVSRFMQKVDTSALTLDRRCLIIGRCFSKAKAHQTTICHEVYESSVVSSDQINATQERCTSK